MFFQKKSHRLIALTMVLAIFLGCQRVIPISEASTVNAGDLQVGTADMADTSAEYSVEANASVNNSASKAEITTDAESVPVSAASETETKKESLFQYAYRNLKGFVKKSGEELLLTEKVATSTATLVSAGTIRIDWEGINDAEGYEIAWAHGTDITTLETTATSYTISNLPVASAYAYQIRYYKTLLGDKLYSNYSDVFYAYTQPEKATGLAITGRGATSTTGASITLSWDAMNDAHYNVYYKEASADNFNLAGTAETNQFTVGDLVELTKYDFYVQAFCGTETNSGEASDIVTGMTCPAPVTNASVTTETENSITFVWDAHPKCKTYRIYRSYDEQDFVFYKEVQETTFTDTELMPGMKYCYYVYPYYEKEDLLASDSPLIEGITTPTVSTGLTVSGNTSSSISLTWDDNTSATGYMIYRREATGEFAYVGVSLTNSFTDVNLTYARNFRYKIRSYAYTTDHYSGYSTTVKTSTLPKTVELKVKGGSQRVRLNWKKQSRILGYQIYRKTTDDYTLIDTITDINTVSKIYTGLSKNTTYSYMIVAYRTAFEQTYNSEPAIVSVKVSTLGRTTQKLVYYSNNKKLKKSNAWKNYDIVKSSTNLKKCYTIPGLRSTNVAGFESKNMVPQGLTFAGKYMLISAYDFKNEENSVIYVMNKSNRKLVTVIVLPTNAHVGGICYDGKRVWIANKKSICAIPYSIINSAAKAKSIYRIVTAWDKTVNLSHQASFLSYYKNQMWIGVFSYTSSAKLYSYSMTVTNTEVTLKSRSTVTIPSAVQGIAFGTGGKLILSRAYAKTHKLEIYTPKKTGTANMKLGKVYKSIPIPYLSEELEVLGSYLYVNFESAVTDTKSPDHMDRVLALKLKDVQNVKKKKTTKK